jgi:hypothetical protein
MKTIPFVVGGVLAGCAILVACGSDSTSPAGTGTISVQLTDAPFPTDSVKSVDVFVVRVDARVNNTDSSAAATATSADSSSAAGWKTIASPNAKLNLLSLQNGITASIGQTSIAAGTYGGFRLIIDPSQSSVTLKNGMTLTSTSNPSVNFPSAGRSGIKINPSSPVTIATGGSATVLVDFNVGSSFVMRGNSIAQNGLLFLPVVTMTPE